MLLRTLGGLELEGAAIRRPKPLLLLAYLALEGKQPRGHLAELFWSGATDSRNRLSVTLKRLRDAAPGAVEADGIHAWSTLACDAAQLLEALSHHDSAAIERLYRGAFLEGLELRLGVELEEWVYQTREHLGDRVREVLVMQAQRLASQRDFERAAAVAEAAAFVAGATTPTSHTSALLADLLQAGASDWSAPWRRRADAEGIELPTPATLGAARERLASGATRPVSPHHNLPVPSTSFVGRERELAGIADLLDRRGARLVTIHGPGGSGKTRLALEVAHARTRTPGVDAVYLVPLVSAAAAADIPVAIGAAIGASMAPGGASLDAVVAAIGARQVVLVLDEVEHLAADARVLAEILGACPRLHLIVTSRQRLELEEEFVWQLRGLVLPDPVGSAAAGPAAAIERSDAVRLFLHRARRARADLELGADDLDHVQRICHLVEGSPLAIELAAVWIRSMTPREIAAAIERSLDALGTPSRNIAPGHQSMRAVFDRSWALLDHASRRTLMQLAVFRDGFTSAAALSVTGAERALLAKLADASLIEPAGTERYRQHALLRQYCQELLRAEPESATAAAKRLVYAMERLAEEASGHLVLAHQGDWFERLEVEMGNLRAALAFAERHAPRAGLRIAHHLRNFWLVRGHIVEVASAVRRILEHPEAGAATLDRARALQLIASAQPWRHESALQSHEALMIALAQDDAALIAEATHQVGRLAEALGHSPSARKALLDALERFRSLRDAAGEAAVLNHLGNIAYYAGDERAAETHYARSLELEERLGNTWGIASRLTNLGIIAKRGGAHEQALALYRRSLRLSRALGDRRACAYVLECLACLAANAGEPERAASLWGAVEAERLRSARLRYGREREEHEVEVAAARARCASAAFDEAWQRGVRQGLDEAVARESETTEFARR